MADEILIQASMRFRKSGADTQLQIPATYFDVAGTPHIKNSAAIGITDETLAVGDVTTPGYCMFKSLEPAGGNIILLGSDGVLYPIELEPGGIALCKWSEAAVHAKALVAPVQLEYLIVQA